MIIKKLPSLTEKMKTRLGSSMVKLQVYNPNLIRSSKQLFFSETGKIAFWKQPKYFLASDGNSLFISKVPHKWVFEPRPQDYEPQPATSCHLRYDAVPSHFLKKHWTLECTVNVEKSANTTYFCVIGNCLISNS